MSFFCYYIIVLNTFISNSAKIGLIVGSSAVVLSGLSLGYAKYDTGFRKKIENSIPYSDKVLNSLLGPIAPNRESPIPPTTQSKDNRIENSFLNKKRERAENSLQLNQNTKSEGNPSKNEDKTQDIQSKQTNEKMNSNKNIVSENDSHKSETFSPKQEINEEKADSLTDNSLLDIDVLISREALKLKEQMADLPTELQQFKELQKRFNDIELGYQRKVFETPVLCHRFDYIFNFLFNRSLN